MSFTFLAGTSGLPPSITIVSGSTGDGTIHPVQFTIAELRELTLNISTLEIDLSGLENAWGGTTYDAFPPDGWDGGAVQTISRSPAPSPHKEILEKIGSFQFSDLSTEEFGEILYDIRFAVGRELVALASYGFTIHENLYPRIRLDISSTEAGEPILSTYSAAYTSGTMSLSAATLTVMGNEIPLYEADGEIEPPFRGDITVTIDTYYP